MKLVVINGSPRGKSSNSKQMLDSFVKGFTENNDNQVEQIHLVHLKKHRQELVDALLKADYVLLGFPLYTDIMPGTVKEYIEALLPYRGQCQQVKIGYLIQSGFPEAVHLQTLKRYLVKLTDRLGAQLIGVIVKGGGELFKGAPEWMLKKTRKQLEDLGRHFALHQQFDEVILAKLSKPYKLKSFQIAVYSLMGRLGLADGYWNRQLKDNKAFEQRFAKPYA